MKFIWHSGCLGVAFTNGLYLDIYRRPQWGMFITNGTIQVWVFFRSGRVKINTSILMRGATQPLHIEKIIEPTRRTA